MVSALQLLAIPHTRGGGGVRFCSILAMYSEDVLSQHLSQLSQLMKVEEQTAEGE